MFVYPPYFLQLAIFTFFITMENPLKKELLDRCYRYLNDRIDTYKNAIEEAQGCANNETKSTAGDKHDTSRAMMQLAVEQNGKHLAEAEKLKGILVQIDPDKTITTVSLGSIVFTDKGNFFLSISAGKIESNQTVFFAISPGSPIGQALRNHKKGDDFNFNGNCYHILDIQ